MLPFQRLGLRCNPFRTVTDTEWGTLAILPPTLRLPFAPDFRCLQILGAKGHGKSTLLRKLIALSCEQEQRIITEYIPIGQNYLVSSLIAFDIFFLDEAQRLHNRQWRRLIHILNQNPSAQFVYTTHQDFAPRLKNEGFTVETIVLDTLSPAHLEAIITRRLGYFALNTSPTIKFAPSSISYLVNLFGGNVRAIEHFLYEYFQYLLTQPNLPLEITQTELEAIGRTLLPKIPSRVLAPLDEA